MKHMTTMKQEWSQSGKYLDNFMAFLSSSLRPKVQRFNTNSLKTQNHNRKMTTAFIKN